MQDKTVTEWQIIFTMTSGKEDFYTEDESEYNEMFQDLIDNNELDTVEQCIRKDYVWDEETEDWNEDWVEILYDSESYDDYVDTPRVSVKDEYKYKATSYFDLKYAGVEDVFYANDWSEVEDFAHEHLMKGSAVEIVNEITGKEIKLDPEKYNEEFDGEFTVKPEILEESKTNIDKAKVKEYVSMNIYDSYNDFDVDDYENTDIDEDIIEDWLETYFDDSFDKYKDDYTDFDGLVEIIVASFWRNIDGEDMDSILNESKATRYNVFELSEDEPNVYNSYKVDTVNSLEQAQDRVAEIQAETGNSAYYDIVDEWWEENAERIIDYVSSETPEVIAELLYDGDIDVYMQSSSKQIALDLYIQLGKEETERIVNEFFQKELDESNDYKASLEKELERIQDIIANADVDKDISGIEAKRDELMRKLDNLEESAAFKQHPSIETYSITDGGWKNNADTVYGKLKDGRYFMYVPEMETLDIYNAPVDDLLDTLYYDTKYGEELPEKEYQKRVQDFNDKHHIENITDGELFDELHKLYFEEELEESIAMNKETLKQTIENVVLKYMTGPGVGFDEDEAKDYYVVEIQDGGKETLVEVRVELDYESIIDLTEQLDKAIKKYDNNAYFDMVTSGILAAVIEKPLGKMTESIVRCDKCGKQIDLDYNSEEYVFDEKTNGGMCIDCAGHYKIVDKDLNLTDEILRDYPMPDNIVFDEEIQILEPTDYENDRVRIVVGEYANSYSVNMFYIGKECGYTAWSLDLWKDDVKDVNDLIIKIIDENSPFIDLGSSTSGYDYEEPEDEYFGYGYESYEEIMTPLEDVKADLSGSYTIARICEGNWFAELHWNGKEPYVEFSWRVSKDEFDGTVDYEVEWFDFDMSEHDILVNLNKDFCKYFGDDRVVESKLEKKTEAVEDLSKLKTLRTTVANKLVDDMVKAMGNDVDGIDRNTYFANTYSKLSNPEYIDSEIKNYEVDNSNASIKMVQDLNELKELTLAAHKENGIELDTTQEKNARETGITDVIDTDYELVASIKKEVYAYCKQNGLDIEKLRKQGVQLETLADTIDKVVGDMVSDAAIEYMDRVGYDIMWDFEIRDNDIRIIYNEI